MTSRQKRRNAKRRRKGYVPAPRMPVIVPVSVPWYRRLLGSFHASWKRW